MLNVVDGKSARCILRATGFWRSSFSWRMSAPQCSVYLGPFLTMQGPGKPVQYSGSWIEKWNQAGISVAGFDMQSCGFSEGLKGLRNFFESFDDIIADAIQFRR